MYMKRVLVKNKRSLLGGVLGAFGGFSSDDQCSTIPIGDGYRKPGNYCATPDGGMTTFNSDGSTYRAPGAVDPDPAHPAGMSAGGGILDSILRFLPGQQPTVIAPQPQTGLSTTTAIAIGGGIIMLALVLKKRG
jgi:hypothetical protein